MPSGKQRISSCQTVCDIHAGSNTLNIKVLTPSLLLSSGGRREKAPTPGYSLAGYREVLAAVIFAFPDLKDIHSIRRTESEGWPKPYNHIKSLTACRITFLDKDSTVSYLIIYDLDLRQIVGHPAVDISLKSKICNIIAIIIVACFFIIGKDVQNIGQKEGKEKGVAWHWRTKYFSVYNSGSSLEREGGW